MPNAERNISDGFAGDAAPPRPVRFPVRRPGSGPDQAFSGLERRISSNNTVMATLQSLEFSSADWDDESPSKMDAGKALDAVLAGGNIETSVHAFFGLLSTGQPEAFVHTRSIGYPNDLWKREPFFGVATPFHSTSVAAAIRKRPDLVTSMGEWYRLFDALEDFPDTVPSDINEAADGIIRDVLKFATFKQSKLGTTTALVGQHMYQIRKRGYPEIDALEATGKVIMPPGEKRQFICTRDCVVLENLNEGRTLSASLLIQGNRVLAMGADDTTLVNQIFERENLDNLFMAEHVFEAGSQDEAAGTEQEPMADAASDGFDFGDSAFDFWPEEVDTSSHSTTRVQLTEEFFNLIAKAVGEACKGTRAIFTARVLITDTNVRIFACDGDPSWSHQEAFSIPPKLDEALLKCLKFPDFEQEIADIEELAEKALERKVFTGCLEHLEFDETDLLDPVKAKMVDILVNAVKDHHANSPAEQNYQALWRAIENAKEDGWLYMDAITDRHREEKSSQDKFSRSNK